MSKQIFQRRDQKNKMNQQKKADDSDSSDINK